MQARWLMRWTTPPVKDWMRQEDVNRPKGNAVLHPMDAAVFKAEVERLGAKTLLEFGPGESTELFISLGLKVTTVEHMEKWFDVARERFKDNPNVRVLKGEDEIPFRVPELGDEKFDLAFVDAPQGYAPIRKIHAGYEDCSRFNTTLFALERCPVVLLHDTMRPLERGTLGRLNRLGYKTEMLQVPFGMARITHGGSSRPDLPGAAELGGAPAGASPGR